MFTVVDTRRVVRGETVALGGRSGAGRSTCANLLLRFWDSTSVRISLGSVGSDRAADEDVAEVARRALVIEFADRLPEGLDTVMGERSTVLSGRPGQRPGPGAAARRLGAGLR